MEFNLQDTIKEVFKAWNPDPPEVVNKTKYDITLSWTKHAFSFLSGDLLYKVEKKDKIPPWYTVYSGGQTTKKIENLAPSNPHRFRLKVIVKAEAVPLLAQKAVQHYGDEETAREHLNNIRKDINREDAIEKGKQDQHNQTKTETSTSDNKATDKVSIESVLDKVKGAGDATHDVVSDRVDKRDTPFYKRVPERRWLESAWSMETWSNTESDGTSAVCFNMAVRRGYLKQVQLMLEERPELLNIPNPADGCTPLAAAVRTGDVNTVRLLLSAGADVQQTSSSGRRPLHLAALGGHTAIVDLLLDKGADFEARDVNRLSVEHYAVDSGSAGAVRHVLRRGGRLDVVDSNGWTPLFRAVVQGSPCEVVEELVRAGSAVDVVDSAGLPLVTAARLLQDRHGRPRESVLRLVDFQYPHEKALANFTRLSRKIYSIHTLAK